MNDECIFCKIANGHIPVQAIYEDEEFFVFPDRNPQAPVHMLAVPKKHYETVMDVGDAGLLGRGLAAAVEAARRTDLEESGFRIVVNTRDDGGQTVYHLHYHILGGRFMNWPPG